MKMISTYCGKLLTDMSKEELIEALENIGRLYNTQLQDNIKNSRALCTGKIELWKRGEEA